MALYNGSSNRNTIIVACPAENYACYAGYIISFVHLERNSIAKLGFVQKKNKRLFGCLHIIKSRRNQTKFKVLKVFTDFRDDIMDGRESSVTKHSSVT